MACKQRGTYAEIRNKLHCSGSGRIAQNPLTSPLSPSDGCQWGKGCATSSIYPHCTLSSFYRVFPIYDPLPPHLSPSTTVCSFEYSSRPLSISHCHLIQPSHFSLLFHPLFLASRLVLFSHSSYLIGHFVLHRSRYYRGNSRTKRRATELAQWCISAGTTLLRQLELCVFSLPFLFAPRRSNRSFIRSFLDACASPVILSILSTKSFIFSEKILFYSHARNINDFLKHTIPEIN